MENPCLNCGACCATFRVSFYWAESTVVGLPDQFTEQVNSFYSCMAGTNQPSPRCHALNGIIGEKVGCGVYGQRPSPCRELQAGDEKCNQARAKHGLPPLTVN
jgi:Fe-S-cluster containining protein